ncbi:hypothetical protein [Pseudoalteromonas pernae]|uniref:hypothetical protein n=1 Tax=Pseudoalteromonas pernae TaxID=3118054 RepID=UPI0032421189
MALINTDWTEELEQVNKVAKKIINDDISPLIDRKIDLINTCADELVSNSAYQVETLADKLLKEIDIQRQQLVTDLIKVGLIFLLAFTLSGASLMWLYFQLEHGFSS